MQTKLSFDAKRRFLYLKSILLPTRLFYRFFLIIFIPMFMVQTLGMYIFFNRHISNINGRLAFAVANEIDIALKLTSNTDFSSLILDTITKESDIDLNYLTVDKFTIKSDDNIIKSTTSSFRNKFKDNYRIKQLNEDFFLIQVQDKNSHIIQAKVPYKRLYSATSHIFILWNLALSLLFLAVAVLFMKNQIRPIRKLAEAAEDFGKGMDNYQYFKISGAKEVRQASSAFLKMRERITKQIEQRTDMLSGISHDLRTPLTRMKLELAMLNDKESKKDLLKDISEMEEMLTGYIAFARGDQEEEAKVIDFNAYLTEIVKTERKHYSKGQIQLHFEEAIALRVKPNSFKRALTNIISNGKKYAKNLWIQVGIRGEYLEIHIDDDGKGIAKDKREDVFKPFMRIEESRNKKTGGIGLGLAVARDIINSHGGSILLNDSPYKGLRVSIRIPL